MISKNFIVYRGDTTTLNWSVVENLTGKTLLFGVKADKELTSNRLIEKTPIYNNFNVTVSLGMGDTDYIVQQILYYDLINTTDNITIASGKLILVTDAITRFDGTLLGKIDDALISESTAWSSQKTSSEINNEASLRAAEDSGLQSQINTKANINDLTAHTSNTNNPHAVTKTQIGLGNVPNLDTTNAVANQHTHSNKALLDTYTQTNTDLADAVNKKHEHTNKPTLDNLTQSVIDNSHSHANKTLLDTYNQTNADITDAVTKKHSHTNSTTLDNLTQSVIDNAHTHSNKTLLDTYTQTEANLADAVAKKHSHNNQAILDATQESFTTALKSSYDTHVSNTNNPHNTTAAQVGLGNVTDDAQLKRASGDYNTFTEKTTPADTDIALIEDSENSYSKKKLTFSNIKTTLKSYLDPFYAAEENDIGIPGQVGFGVGICPESIRPSYMIGMEGYTNKASDNYGNYVCAIDGSIMVWIPAFVYKVSSGDVVDVKSFKKYEYNESKANADGYALRRSFVDGGQVKLGYFIDKYDWSLTNFVAGVSGIASSIKNGNPISSSPATFRDATNNYAGSFSNCISNGQAPANNYGGAFAAAKSRGNDFALMSIFIANDLAILSLAHGQASTSTAYCAWYDPIGVKNFPKGNNNFGSDIDDSLVTFTACDDGYWGSQNYAGKTGSGSNFAKTTHNGQNCGVADINGNQFNIVQGFTTANVVDKTITAISRSTQAVVTIANHGYTNGQQIFIVGSATTEWNNLLREKFFTIEVVDSNSFKLKFNYDNSYLNSSGLSADYVSGFFARTGEFYVLKESVSIKNITGGNSLTTSDHFNSTFITNNFDKVTLTFRDGYFMQRYGNSTNQVLPFNVSRNNNDYKLSAVGWMKDYNSLSGSGTNKYGTDYFVQYITSELCPIRFGPWYYSTGAGVWYSYWNSVRGLSGYDVSGRSCLYI